MSQSFVLSQNKSFNDFGSKKSSERAGVGRVIKDFFLDLWDYLKDWKSLPDFDDFAPPLCDNALWILPKHSWNILDFVIVVTGYISLGGMANVTGLRGIRALRPLRTITRIKEMKSLVGSIIACLPMLLDVVILMAFYFVIFGIMTVQLFGGVLRNRSRAEAEAALCRWRHSVLSLAGGGSWTSTHNARVQAARAEEQAKNKAALGTQVPKVLQVSKVGSGSGSGSGSSKFGSSGFSGSGKLIGKDQAPVWRRRSETSAYGVSRSRPGEVDLGSSSEHGDPHHKMGSFSVRSSPTRRIAPKVPSLEAAERLSNSSQLRRIPEALGVGARNSFTNEKDPPQKPRGSRARRMSVEMRGELPWARQSQDPPPPLMGGSANYTGKSHGRPRRGSVQLPGELPWDIRRLDPHFNDSEVSVGTQQKPGGGTRRQRRGSALLPGELPWDLRGQQSLGGLDPHPPPAKPRGPGSRARRLSVEMRGELPWNRRNSLDMQPALPGPHRVHRSSEQGAVGGAAGGHGLSGEPLAARSSMETPTAPALGGALHDVTAAAGAETSNTGEGGADGSRAGAGVSPAAGSEALTAAAGGKGGDAARTSGPDLLPLTPTQGAEAAGAKHDQANATGNPAAAAAKEPVAGDSDGGETPWAAAAGLDLPGFPDLTDSSEEEMAEDAMDFGSFGPSNLSGKSFAKYTSKDIEATLNSGRSSAWLKVRAMCARISTSQVFELFNACVIMLNAIVLGLDWYLMPETLEVAMFNLNLVFTIYFVVEFLIRITGQGPDLYFSSGMNWFDFLITVASFAEMIVSLSGAGSEFNGGLTAIRLLRLFRLARYWTGLNIVLRILGSAFKATAYLLALVLLFMFVMGLLGMQLFGFLNVFCNHIDGGTQTCPPGVECPDYRDCYVPCEEQLQGQWFEVEGSPYGNMAFCEVFPRDFVPSNLDNEAGWPVYLAQVGKPQRPPFHFDDMYHSFLTVFIIMTMDDWTDIMFPLQKATTPWVAIFFVITIFIGTFVLLQLFLAILLSGLHSLNVAEMAKENPHDIGRLLDSTVFSFAKKMSGHMSRSFNNHSMSLKSRLSESKLGKKVSNSIIGRSLSQSMKGMKALTTGMRKDSFGSDDDEVDQGDNDSTSSKGSMKGGSSFKAGSIVDKQRKGDASYSRMRAARLADSNRVHPAPFPPLPQAWDADGKDLQSQAFQQPQTPLPGQAPPTTQEADQLQRQLSGECSVRQECRECKVREESVMARYMQGAPHAVSVEQDKPHPSPKRLISSSASSVPRASAAHPTASPASPADSAADPQHTAAFIPAARPSSSRGSARGARAAPGLHHHLLSTPRPAAGATDVPAPRPSSSRGSATGPHADTCLPHHMLSTLRPLAGAVSAGAASDAAGLVGAVSAAEVGAGVNRPAAEMGVGVNHPVAAVPAAEVGPQHSSRRASSSASSRDLHDAVVTRAGLELSMPHGLMPGGASAPHSSKQGDGSADGAAFQPGTSPLGRLQQGLHAHLPWPSITRPSSQAARPASVAAQPYTVANASSAASSAANPAQAAAGGSSLGETMPATSSPHDLAVERSIKRDSSSDGGVQGQELLMRSSQTGGNREGRPTFGSMPLGGTIEEERDEDGPESDEVTALDREVSLIQLSARGVRDEAHEMGQGVRGAPADDHSLPSLTPHADSQLHAPGQVTHVQPHPLYPPAPHPASMPERADSQLRSYTAQGMASTSLTPSGIPLELVPTPSISPVQPLEGSFPKPPKGPEHRPSRLIHSRQERPFDESQGWEDDAADQDGGLAYAHGDLMVEDLERREALGVQGQLAASQGLSSSFEVDGAAEQGGPATRRGTGWFAASSSSRGTPAGGWSRRARRSVSIDDPRRNTPPPNPPSAPAPPNPPPPPQPNQHTANTATSTSTSTTKTSPYLLPVSNTSNTSTSLPTRANASQRVGRSSLSSMVSSDKGSNHMPTSTVPINTAPPPMGAPSPTHLHPPGPETSYGSDHVTPDSSAPINTEPPSGTTPACTDVHGSRSALSDSPLEEPPSNAQDASASEVVHHGAAAHAVTIHADGDFTAAGAGVEQHSGGQPQVMQQPQHSHAQDAEEHPVQPALSGDGADGGQSRHQGQDVGGARAETHPSQNPEGDGGGHSSEEELVGKGVGVLLKEAPVAFVEDAFDEEEARTSAQQQGTWVDGEEWIPEDSSDAPPTTRGSTSGMAAFASPRTGGRLLHRVEAAGRQLRNNANMLWVNAMKEPARERRARERSSIDDDQWLGVEEPDEAEEEGRSSVGSEKSMDSFLEDHDDGATHGRPAAPFDPYSKDAKLRNAKLAETRPELLRPSIGRRTLSERTALRRGSLGHARGRLERNVRDVLRGNSLFCLRPSNPFRIFCARVTAHRWFEGFIIAVVICSCVLLCFDTLSLDPTTSRGIAVRNLDRAVTAIFAIEVIMKIVAFGLFFNGSRSYLRSGWNLVDAFVVVISLVVIAVQAAYEGHHLIGLRMLRAACKIPGVQVVVSALRRLLPDLTNVLMVGLLFYYIFSVLSVVLLKGTMHYCMEEGEAREPLDPYYLVPAGQSIDKTWCERHLPPENIIRRIAHTVTYNRFTEALILSVIVCNTMIMLFAHYNMNSQWEKAINYTNIIVTGVFVVEMVLKIFAVGLPLYLRSDWNKLDIIVTSLSILNVLLEQLATGEASSSTRFLPVLRTLRVARVFRLVKSAKGMRKLLSTLYWSIPATLNVALVLSMFIYMWIIVGMNLFGNLKLLDTETGINRHANFAHFPAAMLTMLRILSSEEWNFLMEDSMQLEDCYMVKRDISATVDGTERFAEAGQYLDMVNDGDFIAQLPRDAWEDQCSIDPMLAFLYFCIFMLVCVYIIQSFMCHPCSVQEDQCSIDPMLAVLYFCIYMLVCVFIMLQLVIGVIVDNIEEAENQDQMAITQNDVLDFVRVWEQLDDITQFSASHAYAAMAVTSAIKGFLAREKLLEEMEADGTLAAACEDGTLVSPHGAPPELSSPSALSAPFSPHVLGPSGPLSPDVAQSSASGIGALFSPRIFRSSAPASARVRPSASLSVSATGSSRAQELAALLRNDCDLSKPLSPRVRIAVPPGASPRHTGGTPSGNMTAREILTARGLLPGQASPGAQAAGGATARGGSLTAREILTARGILPARATPASPREGDGSVRGGSLTAREILTARGMFTARGSPVPSSPGGAGPPTSRRTFTGKAAMPSSKRGEGGLRPTTTALQGFLQPVIAERG
ncbi:Ion transport protein-domain-containing protein [Dunaliella salina]|uniref:Ion transport protein-domain-containing protein n=1 Tax=Dunaliella salina TaxID=3046 RepID=A0ABQ7H4C4_DUNSA|nr:Ion transport protein-domain-containing protein [Dunaliella salina]|eukprot:KAF5841710.1 Ion transport protein-domain-containing protein [Dunaliella salina]